MHARAGRSLSLSPAERYLCTHSTHIQQSIDMLAVAPGLWNGLVERTHTLTWNRGRVSAGTQANMHTRTATTQQRLPRRRFKRKRATWSTSIHKMHTCHNVGPCESNAAATATSTTPTTTTSEDFCGGGGIHILSYTQRASVRAYRTHVELCRFAYTEHVKDAGTRAALSKNVHGIYTAYLF